MSASPSPSPKQIAVVGAGISGLTAAFYLNRSGNNVTVYEKNDRAGGCLKSLRKEPYLFEQGALTAVVNHREVRDLFLACGINKEVLYADNQAKKRFILRKGVLHEVSPHPLKFLFSGLLSFSAKRKILKELFIKPYVPQRGETLGNVVNRHFGEEVVDYLLNPVITGIYASNPYDLELETAFPALYKAIKTKGSIIKGMAAQAKEHRRQGLDRRIFNFKKGQQQLIDKLTQGLNLKLNTAVIKLEKIDHGWEIHTNEGKEVVDEIILATPAFVSAALIRDIDSKLSQELNKIIYNSVTTVQVVADKTMFNNLPVGFGFLIPEKERGELLGCIFNHVLFPSRFDEKTAAFNLFVGGKTTLGDTAKIDKAIAEFERITACKEKITRVGSHYWENGIPLIGVGHKKIMEEIDRVENSLEGLYFLGNYRNGVSVGDCIKNGTRLAQKLINQDDTSNYSTTQQGGII